MELSCESSETLNGAERLTTRSIQVVLRILFDGRGEVGLAVSGKLMEAIEACGEGEALMKEIVRPADLTPAQRKKVGVASLRERATSNLLKKLGFGMVKWHLERLYLAALPATQTGVTFDERKNSWWCTACKVELSYSGLNNHGKSELHLSAIAFSYMREQPENTNDEFKEALLGVIEVLTNLSIFPQTFEATGRRASLGSASCAMPPSPSCRQRRCTSVGWVTDQSLSGRTT